MSKGFSPLQALRVASTIMIWPFFIIVLNVKNITKLDEWQDVLNEQDKLVVVQFYADW